jgi:hypothetical protein
MSPVQPDKVIFHLTEYDMSLYLIPRVSAGYKHALLNEFLEPVAAGLAIVTGPSPEMTCLSKKHGFGVIAARFEESDLANVLNSRNEKHINDMKVKALVAAEMLNTDVEMVKLLGIYGKLIGK